MESNTPSKNPSSVNPDRQSVVYVMPPQEIDANEINVWQLFLPLIKYKVQIILFLLLGTIVGIAIPWLFGNTLYTNTVEYQFDKIRFENRKELIIPEELVTFSKSKEILSFPSKYEGIITGEFVDDNIVFTGVTNDPNNTIEALALFHSFIKKRNRKTITDYYDLKIRELKREKAIINRSFFSPYRSEEKIKYVKTGSKIIFYFQDKDIFYIQEIRQVGDIILEVTTKVSSQKNIIGISEPKLKLLVSHLREKSTIAYDMMTSLQEYQQLSKQLLQLIIKQKVNNEIIFVLNEKKSQEGMKPSDFMSYQEKIIAFKKKSMELADKTGVLRSKIDRLKINISNLEKLTDRITNLKTQLRDLPSGATIEELLNDLLVDSQNKQDSAEYLRKMEDFREYFGKMEDFREYFGKIADSRDYFGIMEKIDEVLQKLNVSRYLIHEEYFQAFDVISMPSLDTIRRDFKLSFFSENITFDPNAVETEKRNDISPINYSKKILFGCLFIALLAAIASIYARIMISKIKENDAFQEHKREFAEALKFWKL
jgi:hypothetical protein